MNYLLYQIPQTLSIQSLQRCCGADARQLKSCHQVGVNFKGLLFGKYHAFIAITVLFHKELGKK